MALFPPKKPTPVPAPIPMPATAKPSTLSSEDIARARNIGSQIHGRFAQTLVGQDNLRESLIITLVAGGHILIESVPGLAKTTAAQTLATSVSGSFKRVQCTPDLMPSDLIGTQVFDFATQKFSTQIGPIHANFVLLDEINRSNAKTQSAMLEAMAEGATTIGGQRIALPKPFMVIATQNPIELEGTYPLPEAQLDRFMTCMRFGYPQAQTEERMVMSDHAFRPLQGLRRVADIERIQAIRELCARVRLSQPVAHYLVALTSGTRHTDGVSYGVSPRGSLQLAAMSRAKA